MAREIKTIIKLSKSQTKEFIASLIDTKNEKKRKITIEKAKRTKFNVVL